MRTTLLRQALSIMAIILVTVLGSFGCAGPARTTRLTVDDLNAISTEIAQQLAAADVFASRSPESPRWVIAIRKVENLTSDVMGQAERWYIMERIRAQTPVAALWRERNMRFVIPEEQRRAVRERFEIQLEAPGFGDERAPTHVMEGTFRSVTRAVSRGRTELYYFEATLLDLATGQPVWSGTFEYKRDARGHVWD